MKEIVENNKLIAEFMGWKQVLTYNGYAWDMPNVDKSQKSLFGDLVDTKENGKYHDSWDWLMPVVERIEKYKGTTVAIYRGGTSIRSWNIRGDYFEGRGKNRLEATYEAVVEFIKWYNEQKS